MSASEVARAGATPLWPAPLWPRTGHTSTRESLLDRVLTNIADIGWPIGRVKVPPFHDRRVENRLPGHEPPPPRPGEVPVAAQLIADHPE